MKATADIVISGASPAVLAAAVDSAGRGLRVIVVCRSPRKDLAPCLRGMMRAAGVPLRRLVAVITGAEVVFADGVGEIEAVVVRVIQSGRLLGLNASQVLWCGPIAPGRVATSPRAIRLRTPAWRSEGSRRRRRGRRSPSRAESGEGASRRPSCRPRPRPLPGSLPWRQA